MYENLHFSRSPLGWSTTPRVQGAAPPGPGKADDTYETLEMSPVDKGLAKNKAQEPTDWQQEQCLGQAGKAPSQAQDQVAQPRAALVQAQQKGKCSQKELHQLGTELKEAKASLALAQVELAWAQEQARSLQQQLNKSSGSKTNAQICQVTGCCPETWVLHSGKCLFLSKQKKTWHESKEACEWESSRLLVIRDWDNTTMPSFLANTNALYWIGLWQDPDREGRWTWIDGTLYPESWKFKGPGHYGAIKGGIIEKPSSYVHLHSVCEKPTRHH
ncbi:CD209 antigen-like [Alligator sinensis]|uniref:CD209 antigen-like n=1 Tax=Alligator sinensis TaxID=38654 RepID=A0A3Q0G090_ALLSI|nr:CD209 antigen-like [Alligator sinensis]